MKKKIPDNAKREPQGPMEKTVLPEKTDPNRLPWLLAPWSPENGFGEALRDPKGFLGDPQEPRLVSEEGPQGGEGVA